jgi:hypothetical protein
MRLPLVGLIDVLQITEQEKIRGYTGAKIPQKTSAFGDAGTL